MGRWIFFAIVAISGVASGAGCLPDFASLSVPDHDAMAVATYRQLFDAIGKGHVTPETLRKMIAGGDPFLLPEQTGSDFQMLSRSLREFEKLLKKSAVDPARARPLLLAELSRLADAVTQAEARAWRAVTGERRDFVVHLPGGLSDVQFSPHGEWALSLVDSGSLQVYDAATRKVFTQLLPREHLLASAHFMPDGNRILFSAIKPETMRGKQAFVSALYLVPFDHGTLDWEAATRILSPSRQHHIESIHSTGDPAKILYRIHGEHGYFLLDTIGETITRVAVPESIQAARKWYSPFTPEKKRVFLDDVLPHSLTLVLIAVSGKGKPRDTHLANVRPDGTLEFQGPARTLPVRAESAFVSTDGQSTVARVMPHELRVYPKSGKGYQLLESAVDVPWGERNTLNILPHPVWNEVFIITSYADRVLVELFDLATKQSVLAFEAGAFSKRKMPSLSEDGEKLFIINRDGSITVFNVTMRR